MPENSSEDHSSKRPREASEEDAQNDSKAAKTQTAYKIISGSYANKGLKSALEDVEKEVRHVIVPYP
jgi:hypothetical protein